MSKVIYASSVNFIRTAVCIAEIDGKPERVIVRRFRVDRGTPDGVARFTETHRNTRKYPVQDNA